MSTERRRIFAFSGVLKPQPGGPPPHALLNFPLSLAAASRPVRRLCYIPTAAGDRQDDIDHYTAWFAERGDVEFSYLRLFTQPNVPDVRAHLLSQDVILVEGGSVVNLVAVWRAHGLPQVLRECWEAGTVLAGASAGSLCWHIGGPTDSYRDNLDPFTDGLAFLPYSNGVHDDLDDQPRRTAFRELVGERQAARRIRDRRRRRAPLRRNNTPRSRDHRARQARMARHPRRQRRLRGAGHRPPPRPVSRLPRHDGDRSGSHQAGVTRMVCDNSAWLEALAGPGLAMTTARTPARR